MGEPIDVATLVARIFFRELVDPRRPTSTDPSDLSGSSLDATIRRTATASKDEACCIVTRCGSGCIIGQSHLVRVALAGPRSQKLLRRQSAQPTHFSKILQHSKVVGRTRPDTINQVYTAPRSFRSRNDYGLKRRLPPQVSSQSPWISLREIDTTYGQTDYRSAAKEAKFVSMWKETELGASTAPKGHGWMERPMPPIRLESSHFDRGSREGVFTTRRLKEQRGDEPVEERMRAPAIDGMDRSSFDALLQRLAHPAMQQDFRRFLAHREARRRKTSYRPVSTASSSSEQPEDPASDDDVNLYEFVQQDALVLRRAIEEFFEHLAATRSRPTESDIDPFPHPNLGLSYGHPDDLHSERLTAPLPGRVLDSVDRTSGRQAVSFAGIVAQLERAGDFGLGTTSYEPDERGNHNLSQGKGDFRVDSPLQRPSVDPFNLPSLDDFQGFADRDPGAPPRWTDPRDRRKVLNGGRVKVHVREAGKMDKTRPNPQKVGTMDWVGSPQQAAAGTLGSELLGILTREPGQQFTFNDGKDLSKERSAAGRRRGDSYRWADDDSGEALMRVLRNLGADSPEDGDGGAGAVGDGRKP